ncbi:hypothetical protein [Desulfatibacillum aliphaticivorans]|uniref:hypothetical protein n=1 Tax=Desulfatibacillum aliphaticivorans TaxID=218208 RepID=UPI0003F515AB|nr:hypothetical protein [Desulfatibacillum aliphaticivorans]
MQPIDHEKVKDFISSLDESVPKEGAAVRMDQYGGGPDESGIRANQAGYLRLGIEFLKAAYAEPAYRDKGGDDVDREYLDVDLEYLVSLESDVNFDSFERTENVELINEDLANIGRLNVLAGCVITVGLIFFIIWGVSSFFMTVSKWIL